MAPDFEPEQLRALQARRDAYLAVVREAVERFLGELGEESPAAERTFPPVERLSGEYYLGSSEFWVADEPWFPRVGRSREYAFSIEVRCLEVPSPRAPEGDDYLGLNVNFAWVPAEARFELTGIETRSI